MKTTYILAIALTIASISLAYGQPFPIPESVIRNAFVGRGGALIIIDCASEEISDFRPDASLEKLAPCSSFKIWNTLIGLENGAISSAEEAFYKWDGKTRVIPDWNKNLTLKEAFQASCVPAFQNLARQIGSKSMQLWIDRIAYGDRDISSGIDVFWLPTPGRKTLLVTPREQANLMCKLVSGKLPFTEKSRAVLKNVMTVKMTEHGVLYGKTGSGTDGTGKHTLGWFVGYVESNGKTFAFACTAKGVNVMGKDARAIVESVLERQGLL